MRDGLRSASRNGAVTASCVDLITKFVQFCSFLINLHAENHDRRNSKNREASLIDQELDYVRFTQDHVKVVEH